ncbi:MAG: hypothetical protein AB7O97_16255 [Planctomycetota bacterium]
MLSHVQRALLAACAAADPVAHLRGALAAPDAAERFTTAERALLAAVDADGLRLTRLIVQKLRLERLLRGDPAAAGAFARDAAAFLAEFKRYCAAVPPTAMFPSEEAALFARFTPTRS